MKFAVFLVCAFSFFDVHAQFTFYVTGKNIINMETKEEVGYEPTNEVFNISFPDAILVHNILDENGVSESQFYKITEVEKKEDLILFTALSGLSGNSYYYAVQNHEDAHILYLMFKEENSAVQFESTFVRLKTFNQP